MAVNNAIGELSMAEIQEIMGNYKNYKKPQNVTFNYVELDTKSEGGTGLSAALIQYPF